MSAFQNAVLTYTLRLDITTDTQGQDTPGPWCLVQKWPHLETIEGQTLPFRDLRVENVGSSARCKENFVIRDDLRNPYGQTPIGRYRCALWRPRALRWGHSFDGHGYTVDTMTRRVQAARKRAKVRPNATFRQNTIIRASNLSATKQAYRARSGQRNRCQRAHVGAVDERAGL